MPYSGPDCAGGFILRFGSGFGTRLDVVGCGGGKTSQIRTSQIDLKTAGVVAGGGSARVVVSQGSRISRLLQRCRDLDLCLVGLAHDEAQS